MDRDEAMRLTERLEILQGVMGQPGFWERAEAKPVCREHASICARLRNYDDAQEGNDGSS